MPNFSSIMAESVGAQWDQIHSGVHRSKCIFGIQNEWVLNDVLFAENDLVPLVPLCRRITHTQRMHWALLLFHIIVIFKNIGRWLFPNFSSLTQSGWPRFSNSFLIRKYQLPCMYVYSIFRLVGVVLVPYILTTSQLKIYIQSLKNFIIQSSSTFN